MWGLPLPSCEAERKNKAPSRTSLPNPSSSLCGGATAAAQSRNSYRAIRAQPRSLAEAHRPLLEDTALQYEISTIKVVR